jgi:glycosyltransferase involved in cell wall biosynthesis
MSKEGFSLILPTCLAADELDLCLKSLVKNSKLNHEYIVLVDPMPKVGTVNKQIIDVLNKYRIPYVINNTNLGCYRSWNKGVGLSTKDVLAFITDDQYFAPDWDISMVKYLRKGRILTSQLVEPGVLKPWRTNILYWCGAGAKEFNEERFLRFVKKHKKDKLLKYGFFIPLVIYKEDFIEIGGWPTEDDTLGRIPNDRLFIRKALERGYEFYHVGGASRIISKQAVGGEEERLTYLEGLYGELSE